ncbi:MAG TPA: polyprenyl synthetase family protein [Acidimicrobiales bacterium]|nr:polyprenyl synthetase family protein [Acidimicrobiales bacterium]
MRVVPATAAPAGLAEIARQVDARMLELLDEEVERWAAADCELREPLTALRDLVVAGGKRLRPAFCHWAYVGAGGDPGDAVVIDGGAAVELLHTFALIHDDIMDASSTRRGTDTIHVTFEQRHALSGWRGEARRFGEGVAILVGDLAFVYADKLLASAPPDAVRVFNDLRVEVNVGQYLDLVGTAKGSVAHGAAMRISRYKSGKYTVERPLHLGAALAGRLPEFEGPLSDFGLPLGEAFQMRDDLLGVFGDPTATGKPVGEDLREGKPTVLFATALDLADPVATKSLERYGAADLDDDEIGLLQEVLVETGAVDAVERSIDDLVDQASAALARIPLTAEARTALAELAEFVAGRDR